MKPRYLSLLIVLLLAACNLQTSPTFPKNLQPAAVQAFPAATVTALPPLPTLTPTLEPTVQPSPSAIPSATGTPLPAPITYENAAQLRPVAIYPLFRRGLLRSAQWSPDGNNIVVDTSLGLQVLSAPDLQKHYNLPDAHPLYFLSNGSLLLQQGKILELLDLASGAAQPLPVPLPSAGSGSAAFALNPDATIWVSSPDGTSLQVVNLETHDTTTVKIFTKTLIAFQVNGLFFSSDGSRMYAWIKRVDGETELVAFDPQDWKQLYEVFNADSTPLFSPDGQRMLYARGDGVSINLVADGKTWNSMVKRIENQTNGGQERILTAQAYSFLDGSQKLGVIYNDQVRNPSAKDSQFLASTLMIYNTDTTKVERFVSNLPARVLGFAFAPSGESFLTTSQDGVLRLWNTTSGSLIKASEPYESDPNPQISVDGSLAAYSLADKVLLANPTSGREVAVLGSYPGAEKLEAKFAGANILAVFVQTPWNRFIETWDIANRKPLFRYPDPGSCQFSREGTTMVCLNDALRFFDMPSGQDLLDHVPPSSNFEYAISDDGNRAAYCTGGSESIYIWELRRGSIPKYILGGQPGVCGKLAFSPDGQKLASASGFYWSILDGRLLQKFSPLDGNGPAAIGAGNGLFLLYPHLVDLKTGKVLADLQSVPGVRAAFFQSDGMNLVLQTQRGIEFWAVQP